MQRHPGPPEETAQRIFLASFCSSAWEFRRAFEMLHFPVAVFILNLSKTQHENIIKAFQSLVPDVLNTCLIFNRERSISIVFLFSDSFTLLKLKKSYRRSAVESVAFVKFIFWFPVNSTSVPLISWFLVCSLLNITEWL